MTSRNSVCIDCVAGLLCLTGAALAPYRCNTCQHGELILNTKFMPEPPGCRPGVRVTGKCPRMEAVRYKYACEACSGVAGDAGDA